MTNGNIKNILDMLNTVRENMLSLPDDMLLGIDPRDNESLEEGLNFIKSFNTNLDQFTQCVSKIESQIKQHFAMNPEEEEVETGSSSRAKRDRIIRELDNATPHSLEENFTYKRPYGFVLEEAAYKGIKTWKNLYFHILEYLKKKNPNKFKALLSDPKFVSKRGNRLFAEDPEILRIGEELKPGFYVEVNLSANHIRNNIQILLEHYDIKSNAIKIYLREDRDADD